MKYLFSLLCLGLLFTTYSCVDDEGPISETSNIELKVVATYDGEPLVMGNPYTYENGLSLFFTRLQFYLSNIALESGDGSKVELSEIASVDFTSINDVQAAENGLTLNFSSIPIGNYTGLSFGIGVAGDLNDSKPADYSSSHPLGETANYWSDWDSYIFTKIEGKVDIDQDDSFSLGVVYHIGSNDLYRNVAFDKDITITEGSSSLPVLEIDLKKIFVRASDDFMDLETNNAVHNDRELMQFLMDNYPNAMHF